MSWLLLWVASAWSAHRTGLVSVQGAEVQLQQPDGRLRHVAPGGAGAVMEHLDGCIVEVRGPSFLRRQWVRSYKVLDAGDGAPPYVGVLRRYGGNWVVDDQNSGRTVILDPDQGLALAPYDGRLVLLQGVVVGAQTLRVISVRSLEDLGPER